MFKKLVFPIIISTLVFTFITSYAKDIIIDNTLNNSTEALATISDITDSHITIEVYGQIGIKDNIKLVETIKLKKFTYSYCENHARSYNTPKIGDNVYISIKQSGNSYELASFAYKTDTVDLRTLNILVPVDMENEDCMSELVARAYHIRSNGAQKEFVVDENNILYAKKDGEEIKIYPTDSKSSLPVKIINSEGKIVSNEKKHDVLAINTEAPFNFFEPIDKDLILARRIVAVGILLAGLIIGMLIIYFSTTKRKSYKK